MDRAVIYLRVSTTQQVDNYSLANQQRACLEYCNQRGIEVVQVFREEGESAKTAERPQLLALMKFFASQGRSQRVNQLVVDRVDRLARNLVDYAVITQTLVKAGVRIYAVKEEFDDSPSGRLVENLMASLAQFDNDARAARTRDGMAAGAAHGRWMWRPPLGYVSTGGIRGLPSLALDPTAAPLVRDAFRMVGGGMSKADALARLTRSGLRTRKGRPLTGQTFSSLLRNPVYAGRIVVAGWDFDGPGDFEAIVTAEEFAAAQRMPTTSTTRHHRDNPDFPLRRIVRCGHCNAPLTGSWSRGRSTRYPYYRCPRRACGKVSVRKERLESLLEDRLRSLAARAEALRLLAAVVADAAEETNRNSRTARATLRARIEGLETRQNRLVDAFVQDRTIDQGTFDEQIARVRQEQLHVQHQLEDCGAEIVDF